ncbi:MAG: flavohemoglobin expression-modulating QEGLA motif protein [Planctomycetaceae bacterium]
MSESSLTPDSPDFHSLAEVICDRLAKNMRIRRTLPGNGRLRMDRQLPFLCVYRSPSRDDLGTKELVTTEAAYLFVSGASQYYDGINYLCQRVSTAMQEHFGTFLLIEIWSQPGRPENVPILEPGFELVSSEAAALPSTIDIFSQALSEISLGGHQAKVTIGMRQEVAPPGLAPLVLTGTQGSEQGSVVLGLEVRPVYQDPTSRRLFPLVLESLRSQLAWALRKAISQFNGADSIAGTPHYHSLGPSSFVKAARLVDMQLSEVSESFDFLLQVTPTNAEQAWKDFQANHFASAPSLQYRPLPYHPSELKRHLFDIEIERVEDPTLAYLYREKQNELDHQISALRHLETPAFLYTSLHLYGQPDQKLVELAETIFKKWSRPATPSEPGERANVKDLVQAAREQIDYYHSKMSEFNAKVEVCNHIASDIMVAQGKLLVSQNLHINFHRIDPLLHHEIGTHLLTYFNGRCQPFRQLYAGLAGYEELQEGIAVLAEYLTGGLTVNRLRALASRVVAVRSMVDGISFTETFARLHDELNIPKRQAFVTTLRAYRGGGLTKDIIYLRGLRDLLDYLAGGHDLDPLYVGKIGLHHLPYIQEMRRRGIIHAPAVLPRFWSDARTRERLDACRHLSVAELLEVK